MTWERVDPETLDLENHRRELVMVEEVLRQTAEYWEEVRRQFELDDNLTRNRYLYRAPSGGLYDIVFVGRTDEPFPSGMEFWYLADGFDQLPPTVNPIPITPITTNSIDCGFELVEGHQKA